MPYRDDWEPTHGVRDYVKDKFTPVKFVQAVGHGQWECETQFGHKFLIPKRLVRKWSKNVQGMVWPPQIYPFANAEKRRLWQERTRERFMEHVSAEVQQRVATGVPITYDEYHAIRGTSFDQKLLLDHADDECIARVILDYMKHIGREITEYELSEHYHDAVLNWLAPLLARRIAGQPAPQETREPHYRGLIFDDLLTGTQNGDQTDSSRHAPGSPQVRT